MKEGSMNSSKRVRLSAKQKAFLSDVFIDGRTVQEAMDARRIRPQILYNWLRKPCFQQAVEMGTSRYHLQARIEAAKVAELSISLLSTFTGTRDQRTALNSCNDLLKIHQGYTQHDK